MNSSLVEDLHTGRFLAHYGWPVAAIAVVRAA
jgi:hypothetical protein